MYIYINYAAALEAGDITQGEQGPELGTTYIYGVGLGPYVQVLRELEDSPKSLVKKYFVKATDVQFPKYQQKRAFGIYRLGDAEAELVPGQNGPYCLRLKTHNWHGLDDLKDLERKLWTGAILPTIQYDAEQKSTHLLDVLRGLLDMRKLSKWQRFILALRLTR